MLSRVNHPICCHTSAYNSLILPSQRKCPEITLKLVQINNFNFLITHRLTAAGYICYLRSVHRMVHDSPRLPWRDSLLKLSPQMLGMIVLLAFVATVLLKAYVIGIVWRCYKYLAMRQHNLRSMMYVIPDVSTRQERDYNTLLPGYEEAIAQSMKQQPPPSYQVAMSAQDEPAVAGPIVVSIPPESPSTSAAVPQSPPPYATTDVETAGVLPDSPKNTTTNAV